MQGITENTDLQPETGHPPNAGTGPNRSPASDAARASSILPYPPEARGAAASRRPRQRCASVRSMSGSSPPLTWLPSSSNE